MKGVKNVSEVGYAATIGTFDGVHMGHRAVIATLRREAEERGLLPLAVTFDPHPLAVVAPGREPKLLESVEDRLRRLRGENVEPVLIKFTDEVKNHTAGEWMKILFECYNVRLIVNGYDNRFGCDGRGLSFEQYQALGQKCGVEVVKAPEIPGCCSSTIRKKLSEGDVEEASRLLGRPFELTGIVEHGRHLGHTIGFPTANIAVSSGMQLPAPGVYGVVAVLEDGREYPAVVNIGNRPTVGEDLPLTIEVHIIGFSSDIYGEELTIRFVRRIRGEKRFPGLAELKAQISEDVREATRAVKIENKEL